MALPGSLVGIEKRLGERKEEEAGEKERGECSPLVQKSDSGSHYTMGSFVSHLFAILVTSLALPWTTIFTYVR